MILNVIHYLMQLDFSNYELLFGTFAVLWLAVYFTHKVSQTDLLNTYLIARIFGIITGIACFTFAFPLGNIVQNERLQTVIIIIIMVALAGIIIFLLNLRSALDQDTRDLDYARL